MRRRVSSRHVAAALLLLLAVALIAGWLRFERRMQLPGTVTEPTRIAVPAGASLRGVLRRLESAGLLPWTPATEAYLRMHRLPVRLAVGTYEFPAHASPAAVLAQLASGRTLLAQVTILEGWTFAEMRHALDVHPDLRHDWRELSAAEVMRRLGAPGVSAEGRFFPDTYRFAAGTSDRRIYQLSYDRMREVLAAAWAGRAAEVPVASADQALVLASIVEKETGRADERAKVAAVFVNRLRTGMRLQSDPTVIYGLGAAYDGNIRTRDLQADTPYNTYTRAGLPPTPIALPGAAALEAALHPEHIDALFFVATGRGDGSHQFSTTLAEHNAAVHAFLQRTGQRR
ncbi:MAG: endolytic transglycosylase MltG [Gammaproteobacteria bacterium]|nr:endolytic transglycosylase MltG [Gammaproteobacteria bacterium]